MENLANFETVDLTDFEVVKRSAFEQHGKDLLFFNKKNASVTIRKSCLKALGNPAYLQFAVNPETHFLLINGVTDSDVPDSTELHYDNHGNAAVYDCSIFLEKLFGILSWEPETSYAVEGIQKEIDGVPLFLFDLNCPVIIR